MDGFGCFVASSGSSSNPYMYAATSGYRNDGDAGLSHVGARYYDAQVGRFISRDTFLDQKPYLYCEHDPVNAVDPSGHAAAPWLGVQPSPPNGQYNKTHELYIPGVGWVYVYVDNDGNISYSPPFQTGLLPSRGSSNGGGDDGGIHLPGGGVIQIGIGGGFDKNGKGKLDNGGAKITFPFG